MSDHPVAGRGIGGFQCQVGAHGRAQCADAVLDMRGAGAVGGLLARNDIGCVDAARGLLVNGHVPVKLEAGAPADTRVLRDDTQLFGPSLGVALLGLEPGAFLGDAFRQAAAHGRRYGTTTTKPQFMVGKGAAERMVTAKKHELHDGRRCIIMFS